MKHISYPKYIEFNGYYHDIEPYKDGIYQPILDRMLSQLKAMLSNYCKVLVFRVDLHQKSIGFTPNNELITKLFAELKKELKVHFNLKNRATLKLGYCWVREHNKSESQHYHLVIMLDGNKIQTPYTIIEIIKEIWERLQGTIHIPASPYYQLERKSDKNIGDAIRRIVYLAKVYTKDNRNRPLQTKDYSTSRLKPK